MAPPEIVRTGLQRGSRGFRARRLHPQTQLFACRRLCGAQRAGLAVPRPGAASAPGRCNDPAHRSRPPDPGPSTGIARLGRKPGMARPRALCRVVHARTARLYPDDLLACAQRAARPADAAARRRISSLSQGLVLFDGCRRRGRALHLCAGIASADTPAPRLGAACVDDGGEKRRLSILPRLLADYARDGAPPRLSRTQYLCGAAKHAGVGRHRRLPRTRPQRASVGSARNMGLRAPQPVPALARFDLAGLPLVKGRAVPLYWSAMDIAERLHLGGNPWRSAGNATPIEYPVAL